MGLDGKWKYILHHRNASVFFCCRNSFYDESVPTVYNGRRIKMDASSCLWLTSICLGNEILNFLRRDDPKVDQFHSYDSIDEQNIVNYGIT